MADSDTALAALNQGRQWVFENIDFDVTNVEVDGEYLIVDFRVTGPLGQVWYDDRNRILKPRLRTHDGTFTTCNIYQHNTTERIRYLSAAEFAALSFFVRRTYTQLPGTYERLNYTLAPRLALLRDLWHTVKVVTKNFTEPHVMRLANGQFLGDTLTVYATEDDTLDSDGSSTIATVRAGNSLSVFGIQGRIGFSDQGGAGGPWDVQMYFAAFDTSSLPDTATISGAVLSLAAEGTAEQDGSGVTLQFRFHDYGAGAPTTGDWFNIATTGWTGKTLVGEKVLSGWNQTSGTYNDFSDSGNYGSISKTGVTRMVGGNTLFPTGTPTGVNNTVNFNGSDASGTTSDPKYVITYTDVVNASITSVTATVSADAPLPTPLVAVGSVTAEVAVDAPIPAVDIDEGADATVTSETATVTVTADTPTPTIAPDSVTATVDVTADSPSPTIAPESVAATVTATADEPGTSIAQPSETATVSVEANTPDPTLAIPSETATVTVTADEPGTSIAQPSVTAEVAVDAPTPTPTLLMLSVTAEVTAEANAPTLYVVSGPANVEIEINAYRVSLHLPDVHAVGVEIGHTYDLSIAEISPTHAAELGFAATYALEITMSNETVYVGTQVEATGTFTAVDGGTAVDPTTITFAARSPAGTTTSYVYGVASEVVKDSTGVYTFSVTPSSEGVWTVAAKGTGTAVVVNQDTFTALASIF